MADSKNFNWFREGYELVEFNFEWKVLVPLAQTTYEQYCYEIDSFIFSSQDSPPRKWSLELCYDREKSVDIFVWHHNLENSTTNILEPVLIKISLLNKKGREALQQMLPSSTNSNRVTFSLIKEDIIKSQCQQADGSLTVCCKIFSHVKKEEIVPLSDPSGTAIDCSGGLSTHLGNLFEDMKYSDVIFNIGGRRFPAHKIILAARSEVFDAMFQHPTEEKFTNEIEIEDVEPVVFQELLRFIYTGRLSLVTMETMAAGLLMAADKYVLDDLLYECENYLLSEMSPVNCVELILRGDLLNPAEYMENVMDEAVTFFRRLPGEVMSTTKWEKLEKENPRLLLKVQKILFSKKVN
jgi:speckle-type POZ protein